MERVFELGYTNLLSILLSVDDSIFRPFISNEIVGSLETV